MELLASAASPILLITLARARPSTKLAPNQGGNAPVTGAERGTYRHGSCEEHTHLTHKEPRQWEGLEAAFCLRPHETNEGQDRRLELLPPVA